MKFSVGMLRAHLVFTAALVPLDAFARGRGRDSGWAGVIVLSVFIGVAILTRVLPEKITNSPFASPLAVAFAAGLLLAPVSARLASANGWIEGSSEIVFGIGIFVLILLAAVASVLMRRKP